MITEEKSKQPRRPRLAGIARYKMNTIGRLIEALTRLVDRLRFAFHLRPDLSFENISNHRTRMTMRRRRLARTIVNLDQSRFQAIAIHLRQSMSESSSRTLPGRCLRSATLNLRPGQIARRHCSTKDHHRTGRPNLQETHRSSLSQSSLNQSGSRNRPIYQISPRTTSVFQFSFHRRVAHVAIRASLQVPRQFRIVPGQRPVTSRVSTT